MALDPWGKPPTLTENDIAVLDRLERALDEAIRGNPPGSRLVYSGGTAWNSAAHRYATEDLRNTTPADGHWSGAPFNNVEIAGTIG